MHDWSTLHSIRESQGGLLIVRDRRSWRFARQTLPWVRNHSHIRVRIRTRCSRIPLAVVQGPRRRFRPRVCGGNVQLGFVV